MIVCFDNLRAYWQTLAKLPPGQVEETEQHIAVSTACEVPLNNPLFLKADAEQPAASLFTSQHSFWYDSHRNGDIKINGLPLKAVMQDAPVMLKKLTEDYVPKLPTGYALEIVKNNSDLSAWAAPVIAAFGLGDQGPAYQACLEHSPDKFQDRVELRIGFEQ